MNINSQIYKDQILPVGNVWNVPDGLPDNTYYSQYVPVYNYNNPGNKQVYWVGSSQFDLQYDNESNKFYIEYIYYINEILYANNKYLNNLNKNLISKEDLLKKIEINKANPIFSNIYKNL